MANASPTPSPARSVRLCPYCDAGGGREFGRRNGGRFLSCPTCDAIYRDLDVAEYERIHDTAFDGDDFIANVEGVKDGPDHRMWREFEPLFPDGPILEIGPGTGHYLAAARAAGREVTGVEASANHRAYIERSWGIRTAARIEDVPSEPRFAAAIMMNMIEHLYDVRATFDAIRTRLAPNGVVFVVTCNADGVIVPFVRSYWSMLKPVDHVSMPAATSFRALAARTGFACRTWSGEMPLELPMGLAVSVRDWLRDRRPAGGAVAPTTSPAATATAAIPLSRRVMWRAMKMANGIDPTPRILARFGRAASLRGLFTLR